MRGLHCQVGGKREPREKCDELPGGERERGQIQEGIECIQKQESSEGRSGSGAEH